MICERHGAIARKTDDSGRWPLCYRCFREAVEVADEVELELDIAAMSVQDRINEILERLRWRE